MANESERNDINLCFQALGIEFGADPEDVEKAYQKLLAEIKRKQSSSDPEKRREAAADLELAHDLYEKIRTSVTYNTRLREFEHQAANKEQQKKETLQKFQICPTCHKTIVATLKTCPFCREKIRTPFELFLHRFFSLKTMMVFIVLLLIVVGVVIVLMFPDLIGR